MKPEKSREGSRNLFIYPEKQTPIERLSARITHAVTPYVDEKTSEDDFEEMSLNIRRIGQKFIKELKEDVKPKPKPKKEDELGSL